MLIFLKSNLVPCLFHAYLFLKSNIAMLILVVLENSTFFSFTKEKGYISCFKAKVSPEDKENHNFREIFQLYKVNYADF